jgi:hypothetical protein
MALVIEAIEPGPLGLPGLSVAHYGEQNADLMRDPENVLRAVATHPKQALPRPVLLA